MKKAMSKNKAIIIAMMAIISTSFSNPVSAMDKKTDPPVEIKYLGIQDKNPVFEVIMSNGQADNYFISIRNEAGTVIYSEKLSGKSISRRYRIDTEEQIPLGGLRFEVRIGSTNKTEVYVAGTNETITREMAVNKIQ